MGYHSKATDLYYTVLGWELKGEGWFTRRMTGTLRNTKGDQSNGHASSDDGMRWDDYRLHEDGVWWRARALESIANEHG